MLLSFSHGRLGEILFEAGMPSLLRQTTFVTFGLFKSKTTENVNALPVDLMFLI